MKILLIPDSFKGSASSKEVIDALIKGFEKLNENVSLYSIAASDGGEGFLEAIENQLSIETIWHDSLDPIGRPIETYYLFDRENRIAFIELANTSGLGLLTKLEQNPMNTTTVGTGMQIYHAVNEGAIKIYVGLGGSATNDGGIGLASVLGYKLLDEAGSPVLPIGANLKRIHDIQGSFSFDHIQIIGVNDVANPLYGENGAAYTYAEQKGASLEEIRLLDQGLRSLASVVEQQSDLIHMDFKGAGAAGGTGYGLKVFCNADFISGTDFLFELTSLESLIRNEGIDVIITGEGRIDNQTMQGKLIQGILDIAKSSSTKVVAICGQLNLSEAEYKKFGFDYATTISDAGTPVKESIENASFYLEQIPAKIYPKLV